MNKHCKAAKDHWSVAESGDSKMAAYKRSAEEIEKATKDGLTHQQIADQTSISRSSVTKLLTSLVRSRTTNSEFVIDWGSGSNKRADIAVTVPKRLNDRVKMATELLAQPKVAEAVVASRTPASSAVQQAVSKKRSEERETYAAIAEQRRGKGAMPVSGHLARITGKIELWRDELAAIEPDLIEARDGFMAHALAISLHELAEVCDRIADRIDADRDAIEVA